MRGQLSAESEDQFQLHLKKLSEKQFYDGVSGRSKDPAVAANDVNEK